MKVDFNVNILNALISENINKSTEITNEFPKINLWRRYEDKPTVNQLNQLASFFNIPFGYFFLNELPKNEYPIPHYITNNKQNFVPSNELKDVLNIVQHRQEWAKDILKELQDEPLKFPASLNMQTPIVVATTIMKNLLKLQNNWAATLGTWEDAFRLLITRMEDIGAFVVVNGVVGNNNYRKLDVKEFRGFVLYDEYAPFIFINRNDFISGRIFTIIHEFVHILIGKSSSIDFAQLLPADNHIEIYCDSVAAEFLVPTNDLKQKVHEIGVDYNKLTKYYKVSRVVIARRLLDINVIDKNEFFEDYNKFGNAEVKVLLKKGGDFYNTAPYRIGRSFFNLIYSAVKRNKILYRDAFKITGLTPKSFDGYVNKHLSVQ